VTERMGSYNEAVAHKQIAVDAETEAQCSCAVRFENPEVHGDLVYHQ